MRRGLVGVGASGERVNLCPESGGGCDARRVAGIGKRAGIKVFKLDLIVLGIFLWRNSLDYRSVGPLYRSGWDRCLLSLSPTPFSDVLPFHPAEGVPLLSHPFFHLTSYHPPTFLLQFISFLLFIYLFCKLAFHPTFIFQFTISSVLFANSINFLSFNFSFFFVHFTFSL